MTDSAMDRLNEMGFDVHAVSGVYGWSVHVWRGMTRVAWGLGPSREAAAEAAERQIAERQVRR